MAALPPGAADMFTPGAEVEARLSSSVLLIRGRSPWEVLMMRRPGGADFAPGAFVFPGGSVHEQDGAHPEPLKAAALRELFEESGVLLARSARGPARQRDADGVRALVESGSVFYEALEELHLEPDFKKLVRFTRWITPKGLRRRFDTTFYLARMPGFQTAAMDSEEVAELRWVRSDRALDDPELNLVYATRAILGEAAAVTDSGRLFARARRRKEGPAVEPRVIQNAEGGWEIVR